MPLKDPEARRKYQQEYHKKWYAANREAKLAAIKKWHDANHEARLRHGKTWYRTHRDYKLKKMDRERRARQEQINAIKTKCIICGATKMLDFHHRDPRTKIGSISSIIRGAWNKIKKEISKCDVLCRSCHTTHHNYGRDYNV